MDQRKLMDNASTITDMAKVTEPARALIKQRKERKGAERKIDQVLAPLQPLLDACSSHKSGRSTRRGRYLEKRFCKMFCSFPAAQASKWNSTKKCLQNLLPK